MVLGVNRNSSSDDVANKSVSSNKVDSSKKFTLDTPYKLQGNSILSSIHVQTGESIGIFYDESSTESNPVILPEDAVIYSMNMSKVNSSAVGSIILDNLTSGKTVALNMYSWDKLSIQSLNLQLRSRWRIEFGYSGNGSCSPKLQMNYVYPLKNVPSEDNIQISQ